MLNEKTMKFPRCSARERDLISNFQDAPHGSAILFKICRCFTRERDFLQNFQDASHVSPIFLKIFRMLHTGT